MYSEANVFIALTFSDPTSAISFKVSTASGAGRFASALTSSPEMRSTGKLGTGLERSELSDDSFVTETKVDSVIGSTTGSETENSIGCAAVYWECSWR
uniref:Uncharacterized protein n=1 Tax=Solanum lycopersicum TaxID=4081 RepID=K4C194_SOLLC